MSTDIHNRWRTQDSSREECERKREEAGRNGRSKAEKLLLINYVSDWSPADSQSLSAAVKMSVSLREGNSRAIKHRNTPGQIHTHSTHNDDIEEVFIWTIKLHKGSGLLLIHSPQGIHSDLEEAIFGECKSHGEYTFDNCVIPLHSYSNHTCCACSH